MLGLYSQGEALGIYSHGRTRCLPRDKSLYSRMQGYVPTGITLGLYAYVIQREYYPILLILLILFLSCPSTQLIVTQPVTLIHGNLVLRFPVNWYQTRFQTWASLKSSERGKDKRTSNSPIPRASHSALTGHGKSGCRFTSLLVVTQCCFCG